MDPANVSVRTRIVFGDGALDQLGELVRELGAKRVLLVTDPGIVAAGHVERAEKALAEAGVAFTRHAGVHANPTTRDVDACLAATRDSQPDLFVAVGGGSSIDTAKGANFLYTNGGAMADYWGVGKATQAMLPLIAVPTTAGTGSEVQSFALIESEEGHQKMACGDHKAAPVVAVLDPTLTVTMPMRVAACTGLDAITHAVESSVTKKRNPVSLVFSREAFRLGSDALPRVLAGTADLAARGDMLLAATFAGLAIENSMLGAAHSCANPLTAHHDFTHGQAVATMLPHVVRFNASEVEAAAEYRLLAAAAGLCAFDADPMVATEALVARLFELLGLAGLPVSIAAGGVTDAAVAPLAREAALQWTARFNPREVTEEDFRALYREALVG